MYTYVYKAVEDQLLMQMQGVEALVHGRGRKKREKNTAKTEESTL